VKNVSMYLENAAVVNFHNIAAGRPIVFQYVDVIVRDGEATVSAVGEDRSYTYIVDEFLSEPSEDTEFEFTSRGRQYRIVPERATSTNSNPSSDTMKKDQ
jgi:hypothetical protein